MAFLETPRFPEEVSPWLIGGEEFKTDIVITQGGYEQRNQIWSLPLRRYRLSNALRTITNVQATKAFFRAVGGRANGFRVKDLFDYTVDQTTGKMVLITGLTYQLQKAYVSGSITSLGKVVKPVSGTVTVYENGVTSSATVNYTTGVVTFAGTPTTPLTWAGQFDIPVRFDMDWLQSGVDTGLMIWDNITIVELRI